MSKYIPMKIMINPITGIISTKPIAVPEWIKREREQEKTDELFKRYLPIVPPSRWAGDGLILPDLNIEPHNQPEYLRHFYYKSHNVCTILKRHAIDLKDDPEHLTTDFLQKLIGRDCGGEPE